MQAYEEQAALDAANTRTCSVPVSTMRGTPQPEATATSEILYGELVRVVGSQENGFVEVICHNDNYRGYVLATELGDTLPDAQYRVATRATLAFAQPDIKCPSYLRLPFNARICTRHDDPASEWLEEHSGLWLRRAHVVAAQYTDTVEPVTVAGEHFNNAPYLWGGRTPDGCDCSGLVQAVHAACGVPLPRDSGDQERALTDQMDEHERQRGDLVFWPGHVAILIDPDTVRHANAHSLSVTDEPLSAVVARAGTISSIRRPQQHR